MKTNQINMNESKKVNFSVIKKIEFLGEVKLSNCSGWVSAEFYCRHMPYTEKDVKTKRRNGQWIDGVATKRVGKEIWVNAWWVDLWMKRQGLK